MLYLVIVWHPVPSIQLASELNQDIFRTIVTFSTDSEPFQYSFCNDSETSLNECKIQNLCPLNSSESAQNSECNSELALIQNENQKVFPALKTRKKNFPLVNCPFFKRFFCNCSLLNLLFVETYINWEHFWGSEPLSLKSIKLNDGGTVTE